MHMPERAGQRFFRGGNYYKVNMVGHQAVSQDGNLVVRGVFAQQGEVGLVIGVGEKYLSAVISALCHVMRQSGADEAGGSGHGRSVAKRSAHHGSGIGRVRADLW
jgi:hypothetical protein